MNITIFAYDGMTLLDAIGPHEVLANSPDFKVEFASKDGKPITNDQRNLALGPFRALGDIEKTDILIVPGGPGDTSVMGDLSTLAHIRRLDKTTLFTASVCTGSLILAAAGLLKGRKACTHWAFREELSQLGTVPVRSRFYKDGKYITAGGVSSGIDMALFLVSQLKGRRHAKELQFGIEYFPNRYDLLNPASLPEFALRASAQSVREWVAKGREIFLTQDCKDVDPSPSNQQKGDLNMKNQIIEKLNVNNTNTENCGCANGNECSCGESCSCKNCLCS